MPSDRVFLTASASLLMSANNRLAPIMDRARSLLRELPDIDEPVERALRAAQRTTSTT